MKTRLTKFPFLWRTLLVLWLVIYFGEIYTQQLIRINQGCNFLGLESESEYVLFDPHKEAEQIVREILEAQSVFSWPFILKSSNVKNALATEADGQQFILYSSTFLEELHKTAKDRWAVYGVLAHEIGHHFYRHNFNESDTRRRKQYELQADNFSGGILCRLGASIDQTLQAVNLIEEDSTSVYPTKSARREAVASGWTKACELIQCDSFVIEENKIQHRLEELIVLGKQVLDNPEDVAQYERWRTGCLYLFRIKALKEYSQLKSDFEGVVKPLKNTEWHLVSISTERGIEILENLSILRQAR